MSTAIETRDLRSANQEWKRAKDSSAKWTYGTRPSAGVRTAWDGVPFTGSESQRAKNRPMQKPSEEFNKSQRCKHVKNVVKTTGHGKAMNNLPSTRVKGKIHAQDELREASRSIADLLPSLSPLHHTRRMSVTDNVLYSFDRDTSPGKPLALEVFIKASTNRETERFVEKEYEILDGHGETLKGRKARRNLRKAASDASVGEKAAEEQPKKKGKEDEESEEVDGFELV